MASARRPQGFGSDPSIGSDRVRGSPQNQLVYLKFCRDNLHFWLEFSLIFVAT